jgi:Arc/MetJ-type ribon-helix-helix transcriptional regulator
MNRERQKREEPESVSSLREMILSKIISDEMDGKREFSVMTRLGKEFIEILDSLVKLEIFKSRSEAVAALLMKTILADIDLYKELKQQADKLDELQDTVKTLALKTVRD